MHKMALENKILDDEQFFFIFVKSNLDLNKDDFKKINYISSNLLVSQLVLCYLSGLCMCVCGFFFSRKQIFIILT